MSYTQHGYWIPGTPKEGKRPDEVATCGGLESCLPCINTGQIDEVDHPVELIGFRRLPPKTEGKRRSHIHGP